MSAITIFGYAAIVLGVVGTGVTFRAGRSVLALPPAGREMADWPVLLMLFVIGIVDAVVVAAGAGIALLPL